MILGLAATIDAALAHPTGHRLIACSPCEPLPAQERIYRDAVAKARAAGLWIPRLSVEWRLVPRDAYITDGLTWHLAAGVVRIWLNANVSPERLRELCFHELKHASDFAQGFQGSRLELEERAIVFAARMMGWRA